jgi:hypothetical protein
MPLELMDQSDRTPVSLGPQVFSFGPTNAHVSSTGTWAVRGGKSHQLVVELAGVGADPVGVPGRGTAL